MKELDILWRTMADGFLGYNHSITQIVVYLLGTSKTVFTISTIVRLFLLGPLLIISTKGLRLSRPSAISETPIISLDIMLTLYLGTFIWLDAVWELSLGIVIFPYLIGTLHSRRVITLTRVVFL